VTQEERTTDKAIDFKSATLDTVRLVLQPEDMNTILAQLQQHLEQSSGFFAGEAVVIDASALQKGVDWGALQNCLLAHELHPIGVVAAGAAARSAEQAGLAILSLSRPQPRAPVATSAESAPIDHADANPATNVKDQDVNQSDDTDDTHTKETATQTNATKGAAGDNARPTKVIQRQLRSGQRVYAKDSDLIIIGVVSQGAEVIADGNIHVYGPLRGRAMAGASGNTEARIFTTELDPELIAIAGVYKVIDEALPDRHHNQNAVISLHGESLKIESIS